MKGGLPIELTDKAIEALAAAVLEAARSAAQDTNHDVTYDGTVTGVLGGGLYRVRIQGAEYTVPSSTPTAYAVNDKVLVLFAGGNPQRRYITGGMGGEPVDNSSAWIKKAAADAVTASDRGKLLIDSSDSNMLKYWDGSAWSYVSISWGE